MASGSLISVIAALVANFVIAILKLTAGLIAGSSAMLAEAAHSFSDVGNQLLLLVGLRRADPEPTDKHPFGRGKSVYFWSFMVAVLLFGVAGAYSMFEGVEKILHPHPLGDIRLSLGVLGVAFVIEAIALGVAVRQARLRAQKAGIASMREFLDENRDATLLTIIVEDSLALIGLPIAAASLGLSVWTGNPVWDGIGSIVIGTLLMGFALFLGWEVRELLLGRGLTAEHKATVRAIAEEDPAVDRVHRIQSMYLGHEAVLLGLEVDLSDGDDPVDPEAVVRRIEAALKDALPMLRYVYVEPRDGREPSGDDAA